MSREPWSDERLRDAYTALADRPTPSGLEEEVMTELRERPERTAPHRWRPLALLPGAAAVTVVVIVAVIVWAGPAAPIASPPTGSLGGSPSAVVSPSPDGSAAAVFPDEVLDLPVISVSRLFELTDEGTRDGEVFAVGGWYSRQAVSVTCVIPDRELALLELTCDEATVWLSDDPDLIVALVDGFRQKVQPVALALNPKFVWATPSVVIEDGDGGKPVPVVFLGHVGDERAALCPPDTRATCERQFVVDRVAWAYGEGVPLQLYHDPGLAGLVQPSLAHAESYVDSALPGATVLSVAYLAGETVRRVEPSAGYVGDGVLYVVRVIGTRPCGPLLSVGTYGWSDPLLFTPAGDPVPHPYGPCVVKPLPS